MARLRYRREDEPTAAEKFHHNVYVILLDPKVARHPTILRINPKRDPAKPCVYVGMSKTTWTALMDTRHGPRFFLERSDRAIRERLRRGHGRVKYRSVNG